MFKKDGFILINYEPMRVNLDFILKIFVDIYQIWLKMVVVDKFQHFGQDFSGRWPYLIGGRYSEGHLCSKMTWAGFTVVVIDR